MSLIRIKTQRWKKLEDLFLDHSIICVQGWNKAEEKVNIVYGLRARFRRRTIHEPNLIHVHWIKYMKKSAPESIRNACVNIGTAQPFFPPNPAGNFDF